MRAGAASLFLAPVKAVGRVALLWLIVVVLFTPPQKYFELGLDVIDEIMPLVLLSVVPATPALLLRRFVIRPGFPFVGRGYVLVALYGIVFAWIFVAFTMPSNATFTTDLFVFLRVLGAYELAAIPVTFVYAFLEPRLGLGAKRAA